MEEEGLKGSLGTLQLGEGGGEECDNLRRTGGLVKATHPRSRPSGLT